MKDYTIYVTEEIARKAMEKGFVCEESDTTADEHTFTLGIPEFNSAININLPTAEQICGWLRDDKRIVIEVFTDYWNETPIGYRYCILFNKRNRALGEGKTYRKASLEAISKALDLI